MGSGVAPRQLDRFFAVDSGNGLSHKACPAASRYQ
jgi:hypothetical protein